MNYLCPNIKTESRRSNVPQSYFKEFHNTSLLKPRFPTGPKIASASTYCEIINIIKYVTVILFIYVRFYKIYQKSKYDSVLLQYILVTKKNTITIMRSLLQYRFNTRIRKQCSRLLPL